MTTPLPSYVKTGIVSGVQLVVSVDSALDTDALPDARYPVGSTVLFTPSVSLLNFVSDHAVVYLYPETAIIGTDGNLHPAAGDGTADNTKAFNLPANIGQIDNDQTWYWTARPTIEDKTYSAFRVDVTAGLTTYLSDWQPIPGASPSSAVARGASPVFDIGTVTSVPNGTPPAASIDNTDPLNPLLNLELETGAPGADGAGGTVNSVAGVAAVTGNVPEAGLATALGLAALAPLASPALTGSPTAPTATAGDNTTKLATTAFVQGAVAGLLDFRGGFDASANTFPSTGGSGPAGAIRKADFWVITVAGTLGGTAVTAGDWVAAQVDTPGSTAGNWTIVGHDLGFTPAPLASPELTGNPTAPTQTSGDNSTKLATTAFVQAAGGSDVNDIGYDVILLGGQSNMVSHGTGATDTVYLDPGDPRIKQFGGSAPYLDQLISGIDPLYHHEQRPGTVGHAMEFARQYLKTIPENRTVLLVPCGHSQTGFTTSSLASPPSGYTNAPGGGWDTTGGQGGINLYEFAIAQATAALASGPDPSKNRIVGILWHQGEADITLTQAQYATKLDLLIAGFRSRIAGAANIPLLVGEMLPERATAGGGYTNIHLAHLDTASRDVHCAFYYGQFGYGNTTGGGELHYNNAGQRLLGDAAWSAFALAKANVMGTPSVPPTAVTLQQSGTSVIATVTRSAGRVTDYLVEHRANGGSWSTFSHGATLDVTFTMTGFTLGDVVDVRISTVNEQGTSSPTSATVTLVHVPNSPTLGTATHTATSISPVWTAAGTGDPATSFLVEAGVHPAGGVYTASATVAGSATTGAITGLVVDTSYDYRVTPINAAGSGAPVTGTVSTDNVNALLTDVAVTSFRALSVARKLNTAYAGSCIKVRRSSDNTTQNIGFDSNGDMDVAALLTFCGSGDGFLDTWYDQSGSSRDMTQATTTLQPKIVSAGVLITRNGRAAAVFDGTDDCMDSTVVGLYAAGAASLLAVCELDSSAVAANHFVCEGHNTSGQFALYTLTRTVTGGFVGGQITNDAGTNQNLANGTIAINTSAAIQLSCVDTGTQEANWVSGVVSRALATYTARSGVLTLNRARIGGLVNHQVAVTSPWKGALQESISFASALSDPNRQAGETNQKSYYAIT